MTFLRVFFGFLILYLLFKTLKNLFISNTEKSSKRYMSKKEKNERFYGNITEQKIEDAEFEDIDTEK